MSGSCMRIFESCECHKLNSIELEWWQESDRYLKPGQMKQKLFTCLCVFWGWTDSLMSFFIEWRCWTWWPCAEVILPVLQGKWANNYNVMWSYTDTHEQETCNIWKTTGLVNFIHKLILLLNTNRITCFHGWQKGCDTLTNYMRGSLILFDNYVAGSYWDVEHFQHSYQDKKTQPISVGNLKQPALFRAVIAANCFWIKL